MRRPVQGDELRHEHAVPSDVLADCILQGPLTHEAVHATMTRLCHAVVLTIAEDGGFAAHKGRDGRNLTSEMPDDWNGLESLGAVPRGRTSCPAPPSALPGVLSSHSSAAGCVVATQRRAVEGAAVGARV